MTRESWKDLFEAVGLLAVIASLVFVGMETRNSADQAAINTRAIEIASYQELTNNIISANLMQISDPELMGIVLKIESNPGALSDIERRKYVVWVISRLRHADMAFFQYERGVIDEKRLRSVLGPLEPMMTNPIARNLWEALQDNFVKSFRKFMSEFISEIPLREIQERQDTE